MSSRAGFRRGATAILVVIFVASVVASTAAVSTASPVTGVIRGYFHRDCLTCGGIDRYVAAKNVWCGWQDNHVVIHVTFHNRSVEHVKITWHPSYTIRMGGDHGGGLTSLQDTKLSPGQTRSFLVGQSPKGVPPNSALAVCKPSFYLVESG